MKRVMRLILSTILVCGSASVLANTVTVKGDPLPENQWLVQVGCISPSAETIHTLGSMTSLPTNGVTLTYDPTNCPKSTTDLTIFASEKGKPYKLAWCNFDSWKPIGALNAQTVAITNFHLPDSPGLACGVDETSTHKK